MRKIHRRGGKLQGTAMFVLGAAAGSIVSLLCAPAAGKVTRKRLAMRVKNMRKSATRRIGQTQRALAHKAVHVREAATEWIAEHVPHGNGRHPIRHRATAR